MLFLLLFSPTQSREALRRQVIDMVLATDMKQHFSIHSMFQAKTQLQSNPVVPSSSINLSSIARSRPTSNSGVILQSQTMETTTSLLHQPAALDEKPIGNDTFSDPVARWVVDDDMRSLVLQMGLKCADLGHLSAGRSVHNKWVRHLEEEFFRQGDREKLRGIPVSPLMNREMHGITKSQVGFFDIVALPLYQSFCQIFPAASPMLEAVKENYNMWKLSSVAASAGLTTASSMSVSGK